MKVTGEMYELNTTGQHQFLLTETASNESHFVVEWIQERVSF